MSSVIKTVKTGDTLTISIPGADLSENQIKRLVDLVKAESIVSKSKLSQQDADSIARDINRSWWEKNEDRIKKMIGENE